MTVLEKYFIQLFQHNNMTVKNYVGIVGIGRTCEKGGC